MSNVTVEQWAAALESEDYEQVHGTLVAVDEEGYECYCALGVLYAIAGFKVERYGSRQRPLAHFPDAPTYNFAHDWARANTTLDNAVPIYLLNDDGVSFEDIAKYLREHAKEVTE